MRVVPVIDVRRGEVVRAVGGDREDYEPLQSDLCLTGEPLPLAFALRERYGFNEIYLADLTALSGGAPNLELYSGFAEIGMTAWVDAGVRDAADAVRIRACGAAVVVGTETLGGADEWEQIVRSVDGDHLALSLDLHEAKLIGRPLGETNPERLIERLMTMASEIHALSPARLIVLDLSRVGRCEGPGTERLIERLSQRYPDCEVFAGGGVRGEHDLQRLESFGAAGALVASALHDGAIQPRCHS